MRSCRRIASLARCGGDHHLGVARYSLKQRCRSGQATALWQHPLVAPGGRMLSYSSLDAFYTSYDDVEAQEPGQQVLAQVLDHAVNLRRARPGDVIRIPYEVTISDGLREYWQSTFYSHDRIHTSTPFARALGFQDQVLPFSLMLFLVGGMSHADAATVQVAWRDAQYLWPGFAGDTFTKTFRIKSLRSSSDGTKSTIDFVCQLTNQRGKVCFQAEKAMIFPFPIPPSQSTAEVPEPREASLKEHIIKQSEKLAEIGGQSLRRLKRGQLIVHTLARPLSTTQSMALASLARLTHPRHFNTLKYSQKELLIPGGLVLGLACSLSARDLHEVLYEELLEANFLNPFHPGDVMGSITYIKKVDTHVNGILERLTVRTLGIKNVDVVKELAGKPLPLQLLGSGRLRTKEVEKICLQECPLLSGKIVVSADRTVLRQAPKTDMFLL